jgi:hypothetical protein
MKPKSTRIENNFTNVTLQPDAVDGVFVASFRDERLAAEEVSLSGIPRNDVLAIELGDMAVLSQYVQADIEKPNVFVLMNCKGSIAIGPDRGIGINSFVELTPHVPTSRST